MKKILFLFFFFITFFLSCADKQNKKGFLAEQESCPECKVEYMKCSEAIFTTYGEIIVKASDRFKADSITKKEYQKVKDEAKSIRDKELKVCDTDYIKCCKKETLDNLNNQKKPKVADPETIM
ncbi:hypothetical protein GCM10007424_25850 [Flavobacterium suaedae]|uniref:Lipoprotein n=1 Tax=Flavobacterium suaedae TaxID=1767027 RepID=A0ABQ1K5D6_9FLAO|nr:hypothetical protein [Flavobacterium suaedae]GGB84634.1 hypothetical protein GCM10007424_25850 [Flavobacterium suaedae]